LPLQPGTRLGPYEIQAPLGAGGMGEVYRARDSRLGRTVAIKVLPSVLAVSPEDRARFQREARAISSLNHPHICVLHDIGREGDTDYLVMELVEGETLAKRLARGPLSPGEVLKLGAQIADALDRAHRAGIIHRDLKPGNVMLTKTGVKLMDFGLARTAPRTGPGAEGTVTGTGLTDEDEESITQKGMIVGTFQYLAPEQLEGRRADARSDVWALGCVLYEMATGRRAFEGSTPVSVISAIMRGEPRVMSELAPLTPPAFERLVRACLAKDPEERVQTVHDVKLGLAWIVEADSQSRPAVPGTPRRRGQRLAWAIVGVLLVAGAVVVVPRIWRGSGGAALYTFTPVTFRPMTIYNAAFAPDGKTIVFSASTDGPVPRVYVVRPEFPDPQPVTDPGTHLLAVSSQGELAVLTRARHGSTYDFVGTLARVPLGGGAPREMEDEVYSADWSPDGSQLAISHIKDRTFRLEFPIGHTLFETRTSRLGQIRVSPRGNRIAFLNLEGLAGSEGSVEVVDLAGRRKVLATGFSSLFSLAWSSDGKGVLFTAIRSQNNESVYSATLDGKVGAVARSAGGITLYDVSRAGSWIASRDDERRSVMVHRPEWPTDRDLSWLDASSNGQLSRDATRVALDELGGPARGGRYLLALRKTDGAPVVLLGEGRIVRLSPDAKWVLAAKADSLRLVPTGVGEPRPLPRGELQFVASAWWFPSGDSILVCGGQVGRPFRLYVQGLAGDPPHPVTPEGQGTAAIAPDGSWFLGKGGIGCFRYRFDGSMPKSVPWIHPSDTLLPYILDDRTVLILEGPWRNCPLRVLKLDLITGRRTLFREIAPENRNGLVSCAVTGFSADFRSYAYDASWVTSTLYLVQPERSSLQ
jgi:WD40 repeat protein